MGCTWCLFSRLHYKFQKLTDNSCLSVVHDLNSQPGKESACNYWSLREDEELAAGPTLPLAAGVDDGSRTTHQSTDRIDLDHPSSHRTYTAVPVHAWVEEASISGWNFHAEVVTVRPVTWLALRSACNGQIALDIVGHLYDSHQGHSPLHSPQGTEHCHVASCKTACACLACWWGESGSYQATRLPASAVQVVEMLVLI
jgi:hypothetical protein